MEVEVVRLSFRAGGVDPYALAPQGGRIRLTATLFLATLLHLALGHCLREASCWSCAELPVPCSLGLRGSLKLTCSWLG